MDIWNNSLFWPMVVTWWVIWTQAKDIDKLRKRIVELNG